MPTPHQSPPYAFLRSRRTSPEATFPTLSGLFRPDNAPELLPSGSFSFLEFGTRLRARSSHAVGSSQVTLLKPRLRRFIPPGKRYLSTPVSRRHKTHSLLAFFPSEVFPLTAVDTGFPASSSYALPLFLGPAVSRKVRNPGVSPTVSRFHTCIRRRLWYQPL
jgi:hypothetical protein